MISLQKLEDGDLLQHIQKVAASERKIYSEMIEALEEIERRKLYLARGYSSLFSFCTQFLRYSEGAAQRRIESMRLVKTMAPAEKLVVKSKLAAGSINLTHLSKVSQALRAMPKKAGAAKRMQLVQSVENTTKNECERALIAAGANTLPKRESLRVVSRQEHRLSVNLDNETLEALNEFIALTAHKNPWASKEKAVSMAIKTALQLEKKKRFGKKAKAAENEEAAEEADKQGASTNKSTATAAVKRSRYIGVKTKRSVWQRDEGACQYKDQITGRQCRTKHGLQLDHIQRFARGGRNEASNLRLLCAAHNRHRG